MDHNLQICATSVVKWATGQMSAEHAVVVAVDTEVDQTKEGLVRQLDATKAEAEDQEEAAEADREETDAQKK